MSYAEFIVILLKPKMKERTPNTNIRIVSVLGTDRPPIENSERHKATAQYTQNAVRKSRENLSRLYVPLRISTKININTIITIRLIFTNYFFGNAFLTNI